jgi:four helix bundle protein
MFPREEIYGLISQMRRSASSIPTNIAEGSSRSGDSEFARFLFIAMGSASELEYQILLAHDLLFLKGDDYNRLASEITEIKKMISSLILKLKAES